jgi:hypothetical protein
MAARHKGIAGVSPIFIIAGLGIAGYLYFKNQPANQQAAPAAPAPASGGGSSGGDTGDDTGQLLDTGSDILQNIF